MARKKEASPFELALFALFAVGAFIISFLKVILSIAAAAVAFAAPFILIPAFLMSRKVPDLELPRVSDYDPAPATAELARLSSQLVDKIVARERVYRTGDAEQVLLRNSNGDEPLRFREHSRRGKQLNGQLEQVESEKDQLERRIYDLMTGVRSRMPDWEASFSDWQRVAARERATEISLAAYAISLCVVSLFCLTKDPASLFKPFLMQAWPASLAVGFTVSAFVVAVVYYLSNRTLSRQLSETLDPHFVAQYEAWDAKWTVFSLDEDAVLREYYVDEDDRAEEEEEETSSSSGPQASAAWSDILGVRADASIAEIKTAWREGMKKYHPDLVQGLGPKLRTLAEEETKRLNEAYQMALRARS